MFLLISSKSCHKKMVLESLTIPLNYLLFSSLEGEGTKTLSLPEFVPRLGNITHNLLHTTHSLHIKSKKNCLLVIHICIFKTFHLYIYIFVPNDDQQQ